MDSVLNAQTIPPSRSTSNPLTSQSPNLQTIKLIASKSKKTDSKNDELKAQLITFSRSASNR